MQHKMILNAHVMSRLTYAMPVWAGYLSLSDTKRLNSGLFRLVRLHCWDFSNQLSFRELCDLAKIRSFTLLRIMANAKLLFQLVTHPLNTELTLRLIQQSTFSFRFPGKIIFLDFDIKKHGCSSFINRYKRMSETITFPWHNLNVESNDVKTELFISFSDIYLCNHLITWADSKY